MTIAREWGGAGHDYVAYALALEAVARASATVAVIAAVNNSLVAEPLARFGTDEQKQAWLTRLASGQSLGAFALSEESAGTDAANQQTRVTFDGMHYRLTGRKVWVANAEAADVAIVFASTQPDIADRGITAYLVPMDSPGITRTARDDSLGVRGLGCVDLEFNDVTVDSSQVLGPAGRGFQIARWALDGGRVAIAAQALGVGQAALDEAIAYAKTRTTFGQAIANYQAVQWMLADVATELEAARMLTLKAAFAKQTPGTLLAGSVDGQARGVRGRAQGRGSGDADPRVGRLQARLARGAPVPRRARRRDLPGHVRSAAHDHRRQRDRLTAAHVHVRGTGQAHRPRRGRARSRHRRPRAGATT